VDFWRLERWARNHQGRTLADGDLVYVESGGLRVLALGTDGQVLTAKPAATHKLAWTTSAGSSGGSGTSDHTALTNLRWSAAGHTDTGNRIAGFSGSGSASLYAIGTDLQAWSAELDAVAGETQTGLEARTGSGTRALRTLRGPAAGLTITNPGGIVGDPTFALANDLAAVEGITTTGLAVRTGTDAWTTRAISVSAGSTGLSIANGDGVAGAPAITLDPVAALDATVTTFVITSPGYTTVNLPPSAHCRYVSITCVGGGASGGGGTTGDNTSNRGGGGGGSSNGWNHADFKRSKLPDTIYAYVGAGGAATAANTSGNAGKKSLVEVTNTSFDGSSTPQVSSTIVYTGPNQAGGGGSGGSGGTAGSSTTGPVTTASMWSKDADAWVGWGGQPGSAGNASGTPADLTPFGTGNNNLAGGCGGAGKNTTPTAAAGGKQAASGHLSATVGGTAPGGRGNDGTYGPNSSTVDQLAYGWGGTGGGSHTAGTGGAGGTGAPGCGGGGGGAGTTAGGGGGAGGDGFVVIICFG
jgi:hypothetical protein